VHILRWTGGILLEQRLDLLPQISVPAAGAFQKRVALLGLPLAHRAVERLDLMPVAGVHSRS
jgi:hypothetical protein